METDVPGHLDVLHSHAGRAPLLRRRLHHLNDATAKATISQSITHLVVAFVHSENPSRTAKLLRGFMEDTSVFSCNDKAAHRDLLLEHDEGHQAPIRRRLPVQQQLGRQRGRRGPYVAVAQLGRLRLPPTFQ